MSLTVVILDPDPSWRETLRRSIAADDRVRVVAEGGDGHEALRLAHRLRPDFMLLDRDLPPEGGLDVAGRLTRRFPSIGLVLLAAEASVELVRQGFRAGALDVRSKGDDLPGLADLLVELDPRRDPGAPALRLGTVWTFLGPKAAAGTTTTAVNVMAELARRGRSTLLVDADQADGDCGFYLGLKPGTGGTGVGVGTPAASATDAGPLAGEVRPVPLPGIDPVPHLLESPLRHALPDEDLAGRFASLLARAIESYDWVVVDLAPALHPDPLLGAILDATDHLFLVNNRDLSSLRALLATLGGLDRLGFPASATSVLLGRLVDQPDLDHRRFFADRAGSLASTVELPTDREACRNAIRRGVPVVILDPHSPLAGFVTGLVERTVASRAAGVDRPGIRRRIAGLSAPGS